jgi:hypothetical protein
MALHNSELQASLLATIELERSSRELSETLSRLLPTGLAERLRRDGLRIGQSEMVEVTLLMSDVRGYSGIAETTEPAQVVVQLNEHRGAMNHVIMNHAGIVMQYVGDASLLSLGPQFHPVNMLIKPSLPPKKCTGGNIRLTTNGTALAYQFSVWASAYPPDRSPLPCLAQMNGSNTP